MAESTERSEDTSISRKPAVWVLRSALPGDDGTFELTGARWTMGRAEHAEFRITRGRVSRVHAEIRRRGPVLSIRDLGSTNGTFVDGERVEHQPLTTGAVIRLGEWIGVLDEYRSVVGERGFRELAPGLWGGAALSQVVQALASVAHSTVPVLLVGRTGTGKERFARALHELGGGSRPFHAINCAALPEGIADAELFGYRRGAFTGADRNFIGRLRAADGGTLFLDEVVDLPPSTQAKLLRALDTGEITPLGEASSTHFRARIVAACHQPIGDYVACGGFREDLAARLCGVVLDLPDLRLRRPDVPKLFDIFLRQHSAGTAPPVSTRLYERLCLHAWPGNVRELELLARRLLATHGLESELKCSHLPDSFRNLARDDAPAVPRSASRAGRNEVDLEKLSVALQGFGGNVRKAAQAAGISRQRAYRLIGSRHLRDLVSASRVPSARDHEHEHEP